MFKLPFLLEDDILIINMVEDEMKYELMALKNKINGFENFWDSNWCHKHNLFDEQLILVKRKNQ